MHNILRIAGLLQYRNFFPSLQGVAIFAFSTTAGYYSEYKITSKIAKDGKCINGSITPLSALYKVEGKFEYPFDDDMIYTYYTFDGADNCTNVTKPADKTALSVGSKHKSQAQFFVFTGVFSFLFCLFACLYYAVLENPDEHMYSTDVGRCSWVVVVSIYHSTTDTISRIILVYYSKYCNLIGYSTCYIFLDR